MTSWLHEERLEAVLKALRASGARSILDLGCGDGDLILRLAASPWAGRIAGIDLSEPALTRLRARLAAAGAEAEIMPGSMLDPPPRLKGFDAAALVETIEHLDPSDLGRLEKALFHRLRPETIVITTPNAEFNALLGVRPGAMRRPDHRFEWGRARFRAWAEGAAGRAGYAVSFSDVGGRHPTLGAASQMALFRRAAEGVKPAGITRGNADG